MALEQSHVLVALPTEVILHMMIHMQPRDLGAFILCNKRLFDIFNGNRDTIILQVIQKQANFELILQLFTVSETDFASPGCILRNRSIFLDPQRESGKYVRFVQGESYIGKGGKAIYPQARILDLWNFGDLWNHFKVIDWWVEEYPRLRWRHSSSDRRCLLPHEEDRLRMAVSRWWLYAKYFHGLFHRDVTKPRRWQDDPRLRFIRVMSTRETCELDDLWKTLFETISLDLCSSLEQVDVENGKQLELVGWGSVEHRHNGIVNTYMKLDPDQLKYYLEYRPHLPREDIIKDVVNRTRSWDLDRETLSMALDTVFQERQVLNSAHQISRIPRVGIVDEETLGHMANTTKWDTDAWTDGKPPISEQQLAMLPVQQEERVPLGDSGIDPFPLSRGRRQCRKDFI